MQQLAERHFDCVPGPADTAVAPGQRPRRAFSLIELLAGVAIAGILAAIAVPSYTQYLQQSRRGDAVVFLSQAAGEQTRFFSDRNAYAASMTELGYGTEATFPTPGGYYTVSIARARPGEYTLTATPVANGPQANDACGALSITSTGARTASGEAGDCW